MIATEVFNRLGPAKRQHVIDAALVEFAENGYERASTNKIVSGAKIGKGMLFYYFGSKKNLYRFLTDHCLEQVEHFLSDVKKQDAGNLIERYRAISQIKWRYYHSNPNMFNFLATAMRPDGLKQLTPKQRAANTRMRYERDEALYRNIDETLFRPRINAKQAAEYIRWIMEGYERKLTLEFEQKNWRGDPKMLENAWRDFEEFLIRLEKFFYKEKEVKCK